MTKTARCRAAGGAVVMTVLGWTSIASAAQSTAEAEGQQSLMAPDARVRGASARIVAVINEGAARSRTFRGLVDSISATDGIVYVSEGQCGHNVQACLLLTITIAGPDRLLRILVDPRKSDRDLMGSIGHEMQHALEVLSNRTVRSDSAMQLLYHNRGYAFNGQFETEAAIRAGVAVRDELGRGVARKHAG